eukprot:1024738-Prymnesium_polylepis.1
MNSHGSTSTTFRANGLTQKKSSSLSTLLHFRDDDQLTAGAAHIRRSRQPRQAACRTDYRRLRACSAPTPVRRSLTA